MNVLSALVDSCVDSGLDQMTWKPKLTQTVQNFALYFKPIDGCCLPLFSQQTLGNLKSKAIYKRMNQGAALCPLS